LFERNRPDQLFKCHFVNTSNSVFIVILSATSDARVSRVAFAISEAELCERLDEQTTHDQIEDVLKLKASRRLKHRAQHRGTRDGRS
jgi:hypothetical protein